MSGRFQYNSINFDFERAWNEFQQLNKDTQLVNKALSGVSETISFYDFDIIELVRTYLLPDEIEQLWRWYDYVKDGTSFKLWRNKNVGIYIPFDGELTTTDEDDPTFARTGVANVLDPDTGLITSIAAATGRFPGGKFGRGLLIEEATTNIIDNTEDFSHVDWNASNMTVNTNQITDPEGTTNADKLTATNDNAYLRQDSSTAIGNDDGTFSVYLRCLSGTIEGAIKLYDDTGAHLATENITVTTEWIRYSVTWENDGPNANNWRVFIYIDSNGDSIYAWGAQLEELLYMTTYIQDAGTRNAESCYYEINSDNHDPKTWSISFWAKLPFTYAGKTGATFFELSDSGTTSAVYLTLQNSGDLIAYVKNYGAAGTVISTADATASSEFGTADQWVYVVVTCDTTISNGLKVYINGSLQATSSSSAFIPETPNRLYIGSSDNPDQQIDGIIDDFLLEKNILTADEISKRYSNCRAMGLRRNFWSAVKLANTSFKPIFRKGSANRYDFSTILEEVLS